MQASDLSPVPQSDEDPFDLGDPTPMPRSSKVEVNGDHATITTSARPNTDLGDADAILREHHLDPAEWVLSGFSESHWQAQVKGGGTTELTSRRLVLLRRCAAEAATAEAESQALLRSLIALSRQSAPELSTCVLSGGDDTMVALMSDLHLGKLADEAMTGPNLTYNTEMAQARHRVWLDALKAEILTRKPQRLVLALLGDNAEGSQMREGQGVRVDCSIGRQSRLLMDLLVKTVAELRGLGITVWVIAVSGNHTRIGEKDQGLNEDNLEVVIGHALVHVFAADPGVKVTVATTPEYVCRINGKVIAFAHGDRIRNATEAAHWAYLVGLENLYGQHIDILATAHWHVFSEYHQENRVMFCNGGYDGGACDFARNRLAKNTRPEQVIFGLDDQPGVAYRVVVPVAPMRAVRALDGDPVAVAA